MFSCCTKSKLIHFRSHIFYFRWGKTPEVDKIYLLCTTTVFVSLSFKKFIMAAWLTLKILFSKFKKKITRKIFISNSVIFQKTGQFFKLIAFLKVDWHFKIGRFSSEKMISYFWWICSRSTACVSFDMSWSVVTTGSNTIWKQRIIGEELWWEWNTRIICLKKLVFRVLRKVLEHFLFWLVLSIRKCKIFGRHMAKIICWAKCQLSAIKRP